MKKPKIKHEKLVKSITDEVHYSKIDLEAYENLLAISRNKTGNIPCELISKHVLSITSEMDWPVRKAAIEAVLKRYRSYHNEGLKIVSKQKEAFIYEIRKNKEVRPYKVLLIDAVNLKTSCDCPDFLKNSLGICKHAFTILDKIFSQPIKKSKISVLDKEIFIYFKPIRNATGLGDLLENVVIRSNKQLNLEIINKYFTLQKNAVFYNYELNSGFFYDNKKREKLINALIEACTQKLFYSDPALNTLLKNELKIITLSKNTSSIISNLDSHLKTIKKTLFPYQRQGVERFLELGRMLLADDMGLGKTAQAISCCHTLFYSKKIKRGLLIVPSALKPQWLREWGSFSDCPVKILEGNPSERAAIYEETKSGYIITNYEQVIKDFELIQKWNPEFIVLDEAQKIKNWASKTALYVKSLKPSYRLVLTGTPMENRLEELASVVDWVDELALQPSWRLVPWHSTFSDGQKGVTGARNLDTLRKRLSNCMLRRVRQEVLSQLPKRTDNTIPVQMTEAQILSHDSHNKDISQIMSIGKTRPLSPQQFTRLMMLLTLQRIKCNGLEQVDFENYWNELSQTPANDAILLGLDAPKLKEFRDFVSQIVIAQNRKIIVFSQWRRMIKLATWAVQDILDKHNIKFGYFTGAEKSARRTQNIIEFHDEANFKILFLTDAGGVGLNLQKAADCCVNLDLPWNPAVLEQRIGRIYRLGQTNPVDIYNFVASPGIESRIANIIKSKKAVFSGLFDNKIDSVKFDESGNFLTQLEKIIEPTIIPITKEPELEIITEQADELDEDLQEDSQTEISDIVPENLPESPEIKNSPSVQELFSKIKVDKNPDGQVQITAPKESAGLLASMFESLATMLRN